MPIVADLIDKLLGKLTSWLESLVVMLPNLAMACVIVAGAWFASRWARRAVYQLVQRLGSNAPISGLLATVTRVALITIALFFALGMLGLDKTVASLLALFGVVGLALGFAFQDIAANFMSGFMMALRRPFEVDDLVEVGGHCGKVLHLTLRATELQTLDGLSILIPNKEVFQNPIINYTRTPSRRLDVVVGTAYCDDMETVRKVVLRAVEDLEGRDLDRDTELFFDEFGDSSINFTVRVWLVQSDERNYRKARSDAMVAIKRAFDEAEITIPFPIRTLDFGANVVGGGRLDAMKIAVAQARPKSRAS